MTKEQEEQLMWILTMLPEDQHVNAQQKYIFACDSGWTGIDFFNEDYASHHKDLTGFNSTSEFDFLPEIE